MSISWLFETLSEWNDRWVHYGDHPHLTINPRQFHQDPAGIYLFPLDFSPNPNWKRKHYRFIVEIKPNVRILDLAELTSSEVDRVVRACSDEAVREFERSLEEYPPDDHKDLVRRMWQTLRHAHLGSPGRFNRFFRSLGYKAVFDDIGAIHPAEVQLLVLDPRVIRIVSMDRPPHRPYAGIQKVMKDLVALARPYGHVEIDPPRRRRSWGTEGLIGSITVSADEDRYVSITVRYDYKEPVVHASVSLTRPHLGYGSGASYDLTTEDYQWHGLDDIERTFGKILGQPGVTQRRPISAAS